MRPKTKSSVLALSPLLWRPTNRAETEYAQSVWSVFTRFLDYCRTHSVSPELVNSAEFLYSYATTAASRMVTHILNHSASTWREAARRSGRTDVIYSALRRELLPGTPTGDRYRSLITQNAQLISTFPSAVAQSISARASAQFTHGGRAAELLTTDPALLHAARTQARLIARTEVSKASTALTEARSESLGLPWYVWEISDDSRVRLSHRKMQGVLVQFSDPPAPELLFGGKSQGHYAAGDTYNCRCYPAPVVDLRAIQFPARVYYGGRIQRMTLSQFRVISKVPARSNQFPAVQSLHTQSQEAA